MKLCIAALLLNSKGKEIQKGFGADSNYYYYYFITQYG